MEKTTKTLCQFCQSPFVTQVPPAGLLDKLATLISLYPFRCESCKKCFRVKQQGGQPGQERRKAIRVPVRIPVTFESSEVSGEGMLTDMSLNGCSLDTQQSLRSGLVIKLNLPAGAAGKSNSPVQQLATVVGVNGQRAGLQFLAYSFQERNALTHTVTQSVKIYSRK
jgi:PilZ domain-containing protein